MSYQDILFPILTYPDATPPAALDGAADLARRLGGTVTVLALAVDLPELHHALANALVGLDAMAREDEAGSAAAARAGAKAFAARAADIGLAAGVLFERAPLHMAAEAICAHARTRDLTIMPIGPSVQCDVSAAEAVLFGSGRPLVVFPEAARPQRSASFHKIAIAWDGGRAAARAVADALPALKRAFEVEVVTVVGDKPEVNVAELLRHLHAHGVKAGVQAIAGAGKPADAVLGDYAADRSVDLLVMGGYGHARAREILLGGVTAAMLNAPPCPVLMSH